jgi:hypothetical protein
MAKTDQVSIKGISSMHTTWMYRDCNPRSIASNSRAKDRASRVAAEAKHTIAAAEAAIDTQQQHTLGQAQ